VNHKDLVLSVRSRCDGVTKEQVREVLTHLVDVVTESLCKGDTVRLEGLGTLDVVWLEEKCVKTGIDGESHNLPRRRVPKFRFSRVLRKSVSSKEVDHGDG